MRKLIAVWSLKRGVIYPAEELGPADQYLGLLSAEQDEAKDRVVLQRRATARYQVERDRPPTWPELRAVAITERALGVR